MKLCHTSLNIYIYMQVNAKANIKNFIFQVNLCNNRFCHLYFPHLFIHLICQPFHQICLFHIVSYKAQCNSSDEKMSSPVSFNISFYIFNCQTVVKVPLPPPCTWTQTTASKVHCSVLAAIQPSVV